MHMLSKKDLTAELDTLRVSRNLTKVSTASGSIETIEEETDSVRQRLGSLRHREVSPRYSCSPISAKTLRRSWVLLRMESGTSATFHNGWQNNSLQVGKLRACLCSWFIERSQQFNNRIFF